MKTPRILILLLISSLVLLAAFFLLQGPKRLRLDRSPDKLYGEFMNILPQDLSDGQVAEIEGLLYRFQQQTYDHQLPIDDEVEIKRLLTRFVTQGSITRKELNIVMARVGYYSVRGSTPDSLGAHPLLGDSL